MRLFESQIYHFNWWIVIWGKRTRPLTSGVHFLECPLIRYFTGFFSFTFSCAWAGYECSFPLTTLLVFVVPNIVFCLKLFCISEGKIVCWQQDHINNFIISTNYLIRLSFSQTIRKWDHKNLGNLLPQVPSNPPTLPQRSSRTSRGIRKNFYFYPLINSCFFIFFWN